MLTAVIGDDEPLAVARLEIALAQVGGVDIVGVATNGDEVVARVNACLPDLLFLDVQMPGMTGLEALRRLDADPLPVVVFVTAFNRFACEAFELAAVDYLLKPFAFDRLQEAVTRAGALIDQRQAKNQLARLHDVLDRLERGDASPDQDVWVVRRGETVRLNPREIQWLEAERDYVRIHATGGEYLIRDSIQRLTEALGRRFVRVHRSASVNVDYVKRSISKGDGGAKVVLQSGAEVRLGRMYQADWRRRIALN